MLSLIIAILFTACKGSHYRWLSRGGLGRGGQVSRQKGGGGIKLDRLFRSGRR